MTEADTVQPLRLKPMAKLVPAAGLSATQAERQVAGMGVPQLEVRRCVLLDFYCNLPISLSDSFWYSKQLELSELRRQLKRLLNVCPTYD